MIAADTEFLTLKGWTRAGELERGVEVATIGEDTYTFEPLLSVQNKGVEELTRISRYGLDMCVGERVPLLGMLYKGNRHLERRTIDVKVLCRKLSAEGYYSGAIFRDVFHEDTGEQTATKSEVARWIHGLPSFAYGPVTCLLKSVCYRHLKRWADDQPIIKDSGVSRVAFVRDSIAWQRMSRGELSSVFALLMLLYARHGLRGVRIESVSHEDYDAIQMMALAYGFLAIHDTSGTVWLTKVAANTRLMRWTICDQMRVPAVEFKSTNGGLVLTRYRKQISAQCPENYFGP